MKKEFRSHRRYPTGVDVARASGIAPSTVSLALSDRWRAYRVAEKTRRRVLRVARQLNYRPSRLAASLRLKKSNVIGLVIRTFEHPYQAHMNELIVSKLQAHNFDVLVAIAPDFRFPEVFEKLYANQPDGIIVGPIYYSVLTDFLIGLARRHFPLVGFEGFGRVPFDQATTDMAENIRLAVRHLKELGHERIGCVVAHKNLRDWEHAYLAEMRRRVGGWKPNIKHCMGTYENGLKFAAQIHLGGGQPSAYVLHDEQLATGFYRGLTKRGIRVPDDIAFAVTSRSTLSNYLPVSFTTSYASPDLLASHVVAILIERMQGRWPSAPVRLCPKSELVQGESTQALYMQVATV